MTYLLYIAIISFFWVRIKPRNDRDWEPDHAILPYSTLIRNVVQVHNIRNFAYKSNTEFNQQYDTREYDLNDIEKVYYVLTPFRYLPGGAHTFLSFQFKNNKHIAISIEARKRKGSSFSLVRAFLKGHELTYVIADENDVIKLRSNVRYEDVYVYPLAIMKEDMKRIFVDMLDRANELREKPEFYNPFTNTCTTNLFDHINNIIPKRIPYHYTRWIPRQSDKFFYDIGLLDTQIPFDEIQKHYHINDRAIKFADDPQFPLKIRQVDLLQK
jgi:hypothetical protein